MFDVGFSELVLIALLALIVLGPKRLPEMARAAGRWMAKIRHFVSDVKQDFDREMRNAELAELHRLKQELDETRQLMEDTSGRLMQQIGAIPSEAAPTAAAQAPKIASSSPATEPAPSQTVQRPTKMSRTKKLRKNSKAVSVTKHPHGRTRTTKRTKRV